jgi:thiol-disulfide isomerase/thioredoxin
MKPELITRRQFSLGTAIGALGLVTNGMLYSNSVFAQQSRGILSKIAPELEVPYWIDGNGKQQKPFKVSENRGKWIFLKCFQNWCPGCHSAGFPTLQKVTERFGQHDQVAIAAIQTTFEGFYTNTQSALRKNQLRYQLDIPFGHDAGDEDAGHGQPERLPKTMLSYRTGGTPWIVLINPQGRVIFNNFHIDTDKLIEFLSRELA